MSGLAASDLLVECGEVGHLHKKFSGKDNTASILTCSNCMLVDGDEPQLSNYRACSHAEKMERERREERPRTNRKEVLFQPRSPRTVLRGGAAQQHTVTVAVSAALSYTVLLHNRRRN
jgi:hypothetical protein